MKTSNKKTKLHDLAELKQSIWLDKIDRSLIEAGGLENYIEKGLRGVTSNPAIFAEAIIKSDDYDPELQRLALEGKSAHEIYEALAIKDIQDAADILQPVFEDTRGSDGYISLEVNPHLARKTKETVEEVRRLSKAVNRSNLMIKVPGTSEGLLAIQNLTAEGININVTLLFSLSQYELVAAAYLSGLEQRAAKGYALDNIASVASFFVSRIDVKVDALLDQVGTPEAQALKGKIGIANAKMAYQRFREIFRSERWKELSHQGARLQRVLFGSTSTKNPAYPDTFYPDNLIGPQTINTLPPATLEAFLDHGTVALTLENKLEEARAQLDQLDEVGIDLEDVTHQLLEEGIDKFSNPYDQLIETIAEKKADVIVA
jgi:transaldolase